MSQELTPEGLQAANEAVDAIRNAQVETVARAAQRIVRGFLGRKKAHDARNMVEVEAKLNNAKNEKFNAEIKEFIENFGVTKQDLASEILDFLITAKREEKEPFSNVLQGTSENRAQGKQVSLLESDITEENVQIAFRVCAQKVKEEQEKKAEDLKYRELKKNILNEYKKNFPELSVLLVEDNIVDNILEDKSDDGYDVDEESQTSQLARKAQNQINTPTPPNTPRSSVPGTPSLSRAASVNSNFEGEGNGFLGTTIGGRDIDEMSELTDDASYQDEDEGTGDSLRTLVSQEKKCSREKHVLSEINEEVGYRLWAMTLRFEAIEKELDLNYREMLIRLGEHNQDPNAHQNLSGTVRTAGAVTSEMDPATQKAFLDLQAAIIKEQEALKAEIARMIEFQKQVREDLEKATKEAQTAADAAKAFAEKKAKEDEAAREAADAIAKERQQKLLERQNAGFKSLLDQNEEHYKADKLAREKKELEEREAKAAKEAAELAEKARIDSREWPIRVSHEALSNENKFAHFVSDFDKEGAGRKGHLVKIPEIIGRIREKDETMELHENGLSVAIYDFGRRGLTYLSRDVDAAGSMAEEREPMMTVAKVIDPKGDGKSADIYCVVSSSPERGISMTYISDSTFQEIVSRSSIEYNNAALATARIAEFEKALKVLEAAQDRVNLVSTEEDTPSNPGTEEDTFSNAGDEEDELEKLEPKINTLKKIIEDAKVSLDPNSTKAEAYRAKREGMYKILEAYQASIRRIFEVVSTTDKNRLDEEIGKAKNLISSSEELYKQYKKELSAFDEELKDVQIDKMLDIGSLRTILDHRSQGALNQSLKQSRKVVEELHSTAEKKEEMSKVLDAYQAKIKEIFEVVSTTTDKNRLDEEIGKAKDLISSSEKLYIESREKLLDIDKDLTDEQIDEMLGTVSLQTILDHRSQGALNQSLEQSGKIVEDLYPTRSHALRRVNQYSLQTEYGDLEKLTYTGKDGKENRVLEAKEASDLKKIIAQSSNATKCLESLTVVQKDNARRIASTEFSRISAGEIEMANKEKLDLNEFEKKAATAALLKHWKDHRFYTGNNALASKENEIKEFFEKAKMSDSPYSGPQVTRPNKVDDMATVVFNGVDRLNSESNKGYEGDDIMFLHVRGTLAPNALYVRVQVATGSGPKTTYTDGKADVPSKIFTCGDLIIDKSTYYTKDSSGVHHPKGLSSLSKADQCLCKNFKVKAMSVIDGERKTAILFDGVPIAPQNGLAKVEAVKKEPVSELAQVSPLISLVTKQVPDGKRPGKTISNGAIYVEDRRDPKNPVLSTPFVPTGDKTKDNEKLAKMIERYGVEGGTIPSCEELSKAMQPPKGFGIFKGQSVSGQSKDRAPEIPPVGGLSDLPNAPRRQGQSRQGPSR